MNIILGSLAILGILVLVWLKRKYDPNSDAFRTEDREGWHIKKADVISLKEYRNKRRIGEG
jgi:hypothetical protein